MIEQALTPHPDRYRFVGKSLDKVTIPDVPERGDQTNDVFMAQLLEMVSDIDDDLQLLNGIASSIEGAEDAASRDVAAYQAAREKVEEKRKLLDERKAALQAMADKLVVKPIPEELKEQVEQMIADRVNAAVAANTAELTTAHQAELAEKQREVERLQQELAARPEAASEKVTEEVVEPVPDEPEEPAPPAPAEPQAPQSVRPPSVDPQFRRENVFDQIPTVKGELVDEADGIPEAEIEDEEVIEGQVVREDVDTPDLEVHSVIKEIAELIKQSRDTEATTYIHVLATLMDVVVDTDSAEAEARLDEVLTEMAAKAKLPGATANELGAVVLLSEDAEDYIPAFRELEKRAGTAGENLPAREVLTSLEVEDIDNFRRKYDQAMGTPLQETSDKTADEGKGLGQRAWGRIKNIAGFGQDPATGNMTTKKVHPLDRQPAAESEIVITRDDTAAEPSSTTAVDPRRATQEHAEAVVPDETVTTPDEPVATPDTQANPNPEVVVQSPEMTPTDLAVAAGLTMDVVEAARNIDPAGLTMLRTQINEMPATRLAKKKDLVASALKTMTTPTTSDAQKAELTEVVKQYIAKINTI